MNKPFLIPTEFRRNRLFPQSASPKRYISLMLLSAFLAGAALLLVPRTVQLQIENKSLSERSTALESTLKAVESEKRREIGRDEKEKENLREAIENYKREQESISFELKKTKDHLDALTEEKSYLEEILINKTKEVEATKQRSPMPYSAVSTATNIGSDLAQKLKDKDEEIRKLYDQNKILSEKLERLYQTANSKMAEINVAKIALEDTISEARQTIDNEWNLPAGQAGTVNLGSIQATQGNSSAEKKETLRSTAKKQGKVLAINENHGFIVVDLGKVDGIKSDSVLTLKKNNQTIATLTVLEVRDVMTACNIKDLVSGKKIQINDPVSIQK